MKCLSLHQPWASLLVHGQKQVETRGWPTNHRGQLLIHAAKKWGPDLGYICADPLWFRPALRAIGTELSQDEAECERAWGMPLGAIVGRVDVVDCFAVAEVRDSLRDNAIVTTGDGWRHIDINMRERAFGDYSSGRFAWLCRNAVAFPEPIPCRGRQGLWDVDPATLEGATA